MTDKHTEGLRPSDAEQPEASMNFIEEIVTTDLASGKNGQRVATRFPPEPNGYLHIGHAKSICLNFGLAAKFGGTCNLRFDDTNPSTEDAEYVNSIQQDVSWLGFDWEGRLHFGSDYFEQFYKWAVELIDSGKAYVDSSTPDQIREKRGDYNRPGTNSPHRDRSVKENRDLFERMRNGEFPDGGPVLRAKIDMAHPNMNMRDPIMYRIRHASHHRTGDRWCIYPMYDFAHGYEDALEGITHSICTLEFENHRPLYDWFLANVSAPCHPQQIEFARLALSYTIMSKRKLLELVQKQLVTGWDDPRMPTICGMRRRGYTPLAIRKFCERIGVARRDSMVDVALLEHAVREDLNERSPRVMAVIDPLKVVVTNFPEGKIEWLNAPYFPDQPERGSRKVPFTRELYIEREDFAEVPPKKWHRLSQGAEIRLRWACLLRCEEVIKGQDGKVVELRCTWDPGSLGGHSPDGRVVRGTSHWVSATHAVKVEVRRYDRLFCKENAGEVDEGQSWLDNLNSRSLAIVHGCLVEPSLANAEPGARFQFERLGYFCVDSKDSQPAALVFNETVGLKDSWAKIAARQERAADGSGDKSRKAKAEKQALPEKPAAAPLTPVAADKPEITIDEFGKLNLRAARICEAHLVVGADKLLRLMVDLGEGKLRQVFAGIRAAYPDPSVLVGKQVVVVANLKARQMKWGLSEGMLLAGGGGTERLCIATFDAKLMPGDKVS